MLNDLRHLLNYLNGYVREFKISNHSHLPYEIFAMAAKCRLLEETWDEFMVLHVVHIFLFQSSLSTSKSQTKDSIQISRAIITHTRFLVRHVCEWPMSLQQQTAYTETLHRQLSMSS
jgi:hypothetical protein